ncbi:gluconolactonase [Epidermidibacterium keratini]|uniref:Gluconolactonase n=1 Tax=Epidermidibacterium keratini TaxID=1891644 RepID=A0A7L4YM24_9ACTN|nr:SMP-30/gluconolactonase/LRE family protein [Epidermidibacterium keratini]QHC00331.1 gluconolactonase [Epidermidibacterium keratini]
MSGRELKVLVDGFSFLEGPRWRDGRLWASDFYTHRVVAIDATGQIEDIVTVPNQPSGLGWLPDGTLLVVSMIDQKVLSFDGASLQEYADLSSIATGYANDMVVDAKGRAYVGNFGWDIMTAEGDYATADIALVQTDGSVSSAASGLHFPNGSVITPDDATLIVAETFGNRISAFSIGADGALGERRDWASFGPTLESTDIDEIVAASVIHPDGCTLDAEGALWVADTLGSRAIRVAEGGEILDQVDVGEETAFACALGGDDGKTLFICVAPDYDAKDRAAAREARIVATTVDVPHAGRP